MTHTSSDEVDRLKDHLIAELEGMREELIDLSRNLHGQPEVAFQEHLSVDLLTLFLEKEGFLVERGVGQLPTAFKAIWGNSSGPSVALIAEYDALPEMGHGCGHNLIAASSLGAAVALKRATDGLAGRVVVVGTPAEEGGGGKILLLERGVFDDLDVAMMVHPSNRNRLAMRTLAMADLKMAFRGRSSHAAAAPHMGINALDAVILTYNNINALRQQLQEDVRIHGIITEGGKVPNVIPDRAAAWFFVRSREREYLQEVLEKLKACTQGAAQATGCQVDLTIGPLVYHPFRSNQTMAELFRENLSRLGVEASHPAPEEGALGSSDIGNLSDILPTIHPELAISPSDIVLHTPAFAQAAISERGHQGLLLAAKALAMTALDVLLRPETLEGIRREFTSTVRGQK